MGKEKLSSELVEERGETGRWERRCRGSKCPWKKMSSAGDKSMAIDGGDFVLLSEEEWTEIVKENSWDGDDDDEGEEVEEFIVLVSIE